MIAVRLLSRYQSNQRGGWHKSVYKWMITSYICIILYLCTYYTILSQYWQHPTCAALCVNISPLFISTPDPVHPAWYWPLATSQWDCIALPLLWVNSWPTSASMFDTNYHWSVPDISVRLFYIFHPQKHGTATLATNSPPGREKTGTVEEAAGRSPSPHHLGKI